MGSRRGHIATLGEHLKIPYVEHGDGLGTPVVFLHGFLDSWRSFEPVLAHLPPFVRAFALTQRGHGDASRPESGYGIDDFARDLESFMDVVDLPSAVVVGHSMGSAVAQRFAIDRPHRTLGLVLIGAAPTVRGTPEARAYWDTVLATLSDPVDPALVRRTIEDSTARPLPPAFVDNLLEDSKKVPAFVWREAIEARWRSDDVGHDLHRIMAPTLICWGDQDSRYLRTDQDALLAAIPQARLVVYEGAGHAAHWEQPERFASDLVAFVRGLVVD